MLRLSIFRFADETAVHTVFEDVDLVGFLGHGREPLRGSSSLEFEFKWGGMGKAES